MDIRAAVGHDAKSKSQPMSRIDTSIYANGIRFACQGCGECCRTRGRYGFVYVSLPERRRLARHLRITTRAFTLCFCKKTGGFFHVRSLGKDCIFLEGNRCRVHTARPDQCRTWPFWPENMTQKTWTRDIVPGCPGIGRGPRIGPRKIQECLRQETARERLR
jgi:Fe-S-cluster containining protein